MQPHSLPSAQTPLTTPASPSPLIIARSTASSDRLSAPPSPIDPTDPSPYRARNEDNTSLRQILGPREANAPTIHEFDVVTTRETRFCKTSTSSLASDYIAGSRTTPTSPGQHRCQSHTHDLQTDRPSFLSLKEGQPRKRTKYPTPATVSPDGLSTGGEYDEIEQIPIVPLSVSPSRAAQEPWIPDKVARDFEDFEIGAHLTRSHTHSGIVVPHEIRLRRASDKEREEAERKYSFRSTYETSLGRPIAVKQLDMDSPQSYKGMSAGTALTHAYVHNFDPHDPEEGRRNFAGFRERSRSMTLQVVRSRDSVYEVIWEDTDSITPSMAASFSRSMSSSSSSSSHENESPSFGSKTRLTKWSWDGDLGSHSSPDLRRVLFNSTPPESVLTTRRATGFQLPSSSGLTTRRATILASPSQVTAGSRRSTISQTSLTTMSRHSIVYMTPPSTRRSTVYWTPRQSGAGPSEYTIRSDVEQGTSTTPSTGSPSNSSLESTSNEDEGGTAQSSEVYEDAPVTMTQSTDTRTPPDEDAEAPTAEPMSRRQKLARPPGSPYLGGTSLSAKCRKDLLGNRKTSNTAPEQEHLITHRDSLVLAHKRIFKEGIEDAHEHVNRALVHGHEVSAVGEQDTPETRVEPLKHAIWQRPASPGRVAGSAAGEMGPIADARAAVASTLTDASLRQSGPRSQPKRQVGLDVEQRRASGERREDDDLSSGR